MAAGAIVENKRLGAALEVIQLAQDKRDEERLASKKLTLRQKGRVRESRVAADRPPQPMLSVAPPMRASTVLTAKYGVGGTSRDGFYLYQESVFHGDPPRTKLRLIGQLDSDAAASWLRSKDSAHPPQLLDGTRPPPLVPGKPSSPASTDDRLAVMAAFLERSEAAQKARRKEANDVINRRKRELRLATRTTAD